MPTAGDLAVTTEHMWEPLAIAEVKSIFRDAPFRWWISGGMALELFAGASWRSHDDIDVGVCRVDARRVYPWLGEWELYVAAGGSLRPWTGEALDAVRHENNVWIRRKQDGPWVLDIAIGGGTSGEWAYRRDPAVTVAWEDAVLHTGDGLPYLAPELQLLFKSTSVRPKDREDAEQMVPILDARRREFLSRHLPPDHPWRELVDRPVWP